MRARSLMEPVPDAAGVDLSSLGDLEQIRGFTDTIHYVLPKLLLVSTAFDEGLGDASGAEAGTAEGPPREADTEPGVAAGTTSVPLVGPDEATEEVGEVFEEIRDRHGHPDVASYYRGIAQWPGFLEAAWKHVGAVVNTGAYEERKRDVLEAARDAVLGLPLPSKREALERAS